MRFQAELLGVRGPGSVSSVYGSTRYQIYPSNIQDGQVYYESNFPGIYFYVSATPLYQLRITMVTTHDTRSEAQPAQPQSRSMISPHA